MAYREGDELSMDAEKIAHSHSEEAESEREILYTHWKALPAIKSIEASAEEVYGKTNFLVRRSVVRILRTGIIEEFQSQKRRRHALTAQEILERLPKYLEGQSEIKTPSLTNLYFHLEKLEHGQVKLIQPVAILREKRKKRRFPITYYGRTARIFLYTGSKGHLEEKATLFSAIAQLMKRLQPEVQLDSLNGLLEKVVTFQKTRAVQISEWIVKHDDHLLDGNILPGDILDCLGMLDAIHPEYQKILKEISELLQLDMSKIQ
ncbi:MAG: hypothetical protein ACFFB3_19940 [Candidatus Hodarchaeota archaeon]